MSGILPSTLRASVAFAPPVRDRLLRFTTSLATILTLELLVIKKAPVWDLFYYVWLGDKDSNLGWRSQSPQSCR